MAKLKDTHTTPNLGFKTSAEFFAGSEMAPDYNTPANIDDTFAALVHCITAVWARHVRQALWEINEVFACRRAVPLSDKIGAGGGGGDSEGLHWRAGDDHSQRLSLADFPGGNQPDLLFDLNGGAIDQVAAAGEFVSDTVPANSKLGYSVVSIHHNPVTTLSEQVIGLVNNGLRYYWLDTDGFSAEPDTALFMGVRVPEWNQANNGVVLATVRRFNSAAETGVADRMNFEFGLGSIIDGALHTVGALPVGGEQDRVLYLRYYTAADQVVQVCCAKFSTGPQYALMSGPEWQVGFHRFDDGGTVTVRFYINGRRIGTRTGLPAAGGVGTSPDIRLMLGSRDGGAQFAGGPIRNVYTYDDTDSLDEDLILELYRKHAGFLDSLAGGG